MKSGIRDLRSPWSLSRSGSPLPSYSCSPLFPPFTPVCSVSLHPKVLFLSTTQRYAFSCVALAPTYPCRQGKQLIKNLSLKTVTVLSFRGILVPTGELIEISPQNRMVSTRTLDGLIVSISTGSENHHRHRLGYFHPEKQGPHLAGEAQSWQSI